MQSVVCESRCTLDPQPSDALTWYHPCAVRRCQTVCMRVASCTIVLQVDTFDAKTSSPSPLSVVLRSWWAIPYLAEGCKLRTCKSMICLFWTCPPDFHQHTYSDTAPPSRSRSRDTFRSRNIHLESADRDQWSAPASPQTCFRTQRMVILLLMIASTR